LPAGIYVLHQDILLQLVDVTRALTCGNRKRHRTWATSREKWINFMLCQ